MKGEFGQFKWNCWKDVKPEPQMFVYTYFPDYVGIEPRMSGVDISIAEDVNWDDEDYWCYVFIPDAPKIEKKMTLEEKVDYLENNYLCQQAEYEKRMGYIENELNNLRSMIIGKGIARA